MTQQYLQTQAAIQAAAASAAQAAQQAASRARAIRATPASAPAPSSDGGGWSQVAICEEGGRNSYEFGYFGILPSTWADHDGVSTAGQASWDEQVAFGDSINGGGPPWAPAGCAAAGYPGW